MLRYILELFVFCLLAISCNSKAPSNDSQIEESKMIALMTDVYYLESHFNELNSYLKDSIVFLKFNDLLIKYKLTKEQFEQAEAYYNHNDEAHQRLIDGVKKAVAEATMK